MPWTCKKCETLNPDEQTHCDVCGLERLFTRPEAELLGRRSADNATGYTQSISPSSERRSETKSHSSWTSKLSVIILRLVAAALLAIICFHSRPAPISHSFAGSGQRSSEMEHAKRTNGVGSLSHTDAIEQRAQAIALTASANRTLDDIQHKIQDWKAHPPPSDDVPGMREVLVQRCQEVASQCGQAISLEPNLRDAYVCQVYAYMYMGREGGKWSIALREAEAAHQKFPSDPEILYQIRSLRAMMDKRHTNLIASGG